MFENKFITIVNTFPTHVYHASLRSRLCAKLLLGLLVASAVELSVASVAVCSFLRWQHTSIVLRSLQGFAADFVTNGKLSSSRWDNMFSLINLPGIFRVYEHVLPFMQNPMLNEHLFASPRRRCRAWCKSRRFVAHFSITPSALNSSTSWWPE